MEGLKMMMFDEGADHKIRYRFISDWFKIDSYRCSGKLRDRINSL